MLPWECRDDEFELVLLCRDVVGLGLSFPGLQLDCLCWWAWAQTRSSHLQRCDWVGLELTWARISLSLLVNTSTLNPLYSNCTMSLDLAQYVIPQYKLHRTVTDHSSEEVALKTNKKRRSKTCSKIVSLKKYFVHLLCKITFVLNHAMHFSFTSHFVCSGVNEVI